MLTGPVVLLHRGPLLVRHLVSGDVRGGARGGPQQGGYAVDLVLSEWRRGLDEPADVLFELCGAQVTARVDEPGVIRAVVALERTDGCSCTTAGHRLGWHGFHLWTAFAGRPR